MPSYSRPMACTGNSGTIRAARRIKRPGRLAATMTMTTTTDHETARRTLGHLYRGNSRSAPQGPGRGVGKVVAELESTSEGVLLLYYPDKMTIFPGFDGSSLALDALTGGWPKRRF